MYTNETTCTYVHALQTVMPLKITKQKKLLPYTILLNMVKLNNNNNNNKTMSLSNFFFKTGKHNHIYFRLTSYTYM